MQFQILGYREEFIDAKTFKFLGSRKIAVAASCGYQGPRTIDAPTEIESGFDHSERRTLLAGLEVIVYVQMVCGRPC